MAANTRTDEQDGATDLELHLPAGITPSGETSRLKRLWERLFNHGVESPKNRRGGS